MSSASRAKSLYRLLAWPAVALSIAYIAVTIWRQWDSITQETLSRIWWPGLPLSIALYGGTVALTALGWGIWLRASGAPIKFSAATRTVLVSGIGKYLPGNVGHFVGRAAMTVEAGITPGIVTFILMIETLCIVAVGSVIAAGALSFDFLDLPLTSPTTSAVVAASLIVAFTAIIGFSISGNTNPIRRFVPLPSVKLDVWPIVGVLALYVLCWIFHGASLWVLSPEIMAPFVNQPLVLIGIVASAWLVGFIVPGAPGGLGVREAALVLLLAPIIGESYAVALALMQRLVSSLGDLLAFAAGLTIAKRGSSEEITEDQSG